MLYSERDKNLKTLGFDEYRLYLMSDLWSAIRARVLFRNRRCTGCGEKAGQVHHRSYSLETLNGTDLSGLVPICRVCHLAIEYAVTGRKNSLEEANTYLDMLARATAIRKAGHELDALKRRRAKKSKQSKGNSPYAGLNKTQRKAKFRETHMRCPGCRRNWASKARGLCRNCRSDAGR